MDSIDSFERIRMHAGRCLLFAGLLLSVVGGCSSSSFGLFARSKTNAPQDYWGSIEEQIVLDNSLVTPNNKIRQVSATATAKKPAPALLTLARGEDLEKQISSVKGTVLLDFYADWCGPCKAQGKILHEIEDRDYGMRDFDIVDLNGFRLTFATSIDQLGC